MVRSQANVSLLEPVGTDEGVDLDQVDLVKGLDGGSDVALVSLEVDDESEGVVVLDLLHGGLSAQGVPETKKGRYYSLSKGTDGVLWTRKNQN